MGVTLRMAEVSCPLAAGGRDAEYREACVPFRNHVDALGQAAAASQTKGECAEQDLEDNNGFHLAAFSGGGRR